VKESGKKNEKKINLKEMFFFLLFVLSLHHELQYLSIATKQQHSFNETEKLKPQFIYNILIELQNHRRQYRFEREQPHTPIKFQLLTIGLQFKATRVRVIQLSSFSVSVCV
jgi:hypothetical protein